MSAANILIACGTRPFRPDYVPFDGKTVFDSDEIIELPKLPRSLAVIGAGVIGVEYATIFSALDVAVTLIEPRPTFLDFIDKELIDEFMHELRDRNVSLRLGSAVEAIERTNTGAIQVRLADVTERNQKGTAVVDFTATGRMTKRLIACEGVSKSMGGRRLFDRVLGNGSPTADRSFREAHGCGVQAGAAAAGEAAGDRQRSDHDALEPAHPCLARRGWLRQARHDDRNVDFMRLEPRPRRQP